MNFIYVNRDGDPIEFEFLSENLVAMKNAKYVSFGWDTEDQMNQQKFTMVDPAGGPYLSSGMSLGYLNNKLLRHIIHYITTEDKNILLHLYPEKIVEATINGQRYYKVYSGSGDELERFISYNDAVKFIEDKYEC